MRITSSMVSANTLTDINNALDRLNRTQEELSSGVRINQPSDDPYGTSLALSLQGNLSSLSAYEGNANDGNAWASAADSSLMNMNSIVQRVRELVVQASNGTNGQQELNSIASEVGQLTDAIKQEANTQYNGQYIFSGTKTTTAPYLAGATDTYQGDTGQVTRLIGPSTTVQVNTDLSSLLGNGVSANDGKLLDVLRTISTDLTSGNTQSLGTTDLQNLDTNIDTLTQLQAGTGAVENRMQLAVSRIQQLQTSQQKQLSNTEDTDMASAMISYSSEQASYQAALAASAKIVQESLLNFLQ